MRKQVARPQKYSQEWKRILVQLSAREAAKSGQVQELHENSSNTLFNKFMHELEQNQGYSLDLSNMGITTLPSEIQSLQNIHHLLLNGNKLQDLPEELAKMQNLSLLDLNNNLFTKIPRVISTLPNLNGLYLSGNILEVINSDLLPPSLKNLSIFDTQFVLKHLPPDLCHKILDGKIDL